MLSDMTAEGYVFRTDLRLRPAASVAPVCISMAAAEQYYEAQGRTWERAAFIKARACAGDIAAALGLDMANWWEPTVEAYLNHVPKAQIIAALKDRFEAIDGQLRQNRRSAGGR